MYTNAAAPEFLTDHIVVSPTVQVAVPGTVTEYRGLSQAGAPNAQSIGLVKYCDEKREFASVATVGVAIGECVNAVGFAVGDAAYYSADGRLTTLAGAASGARMAGISKDIVVAGANVAPAKMYIRVEMGSVVAKA